MYYRLFTDVGTVFGSPFLYIPLLCAVPLLLIAYAWSLGADIRRQAANTQRHWTTSLILHGLISLLISAAYLGIASGFAIERGRGPELSGWLKQTCGIIRAGGASARQTPCFARSGGNFALHTGVPFTALSGAGYSVRKCELTQNAKK